MNSQNTSAASLNTGPDAEFQALDSAGQFFYLNAGYSWNSDQGETEDAGHYRTARELAEAERLASEAGWYIRWEADDDDCADGDETPEVRESATLYADGYAYGMTEPVVLASLGSIGDATIEYRRVVFAELAAEALEDHS